jgi:PleD family two-component response regulator
MLTRIRNKLVESPCVTGGRSTNYTFSAGLASLEEIAPVEPIERLIEMADKRLY